MDQRRFSRKASNGIQTEATDVAGSGVQSQQTTTPELQTDGKAVTEASSPEATQSPKELEEQVIQGYRDYLKENDVSDEDVFSVLDAIISGGTVCWTFKLFEKVPVTFRVRPQWVNDAVSQELERLQPSTYHRFADLVSGWNLAGSLLVHGDKTFDVQDVGALEEAHTYVSNLPFIVQNRLVQQLAVFDRVLAVATSDWAVADFTKPR